MLFIVPAALEGAALDPTAFAGGVSWWQTIGGLAVVFGLLFICLKLMARFGRGGRAGQARMLTVWHLGPRREIQVLCLGTDVSYVYRHENGLVLLKQEPLEEYQRLHGGSTGENAAAAGPAGQISRWIGNISWRRNRS